MGATMETKNTTYRNIAYYASWAGYDRKYSLRNLDVTKLTHLNFAFAGLAEDGSVKSDEPWIDTQMAGGIYEAEGFTVEDAEQGNAGHFGTLRHIKEEYPHLKTLISVGGWIGSVNFSDVAADEAKRANMAESAVEFVTRYGFDGVDIDWEFPVEGGNTGMKHRPEDKENYTKLVRDLRKALDAQAAKDGKTYYLTIAGGPNPSYAEHTELGEMMRYLDWVNVMTYDYHAGAEEKTNFNAPLYTDSADNTGISYSVDDTINAYIRGGALPEKLNLGLAFYGRGHVNVEAEGENSLYQKGELATETGQDRGTWEASSWDYYDIKDNYLNQRGYVRYWNEAAKVPYLYSTETKVFISYDDEVSIREKIEYLKAKGLGGAMFWEASADKNGDLLAVTAKDLGIDYK